ncbi:MAG TPA: DUF3127 domain-containing protein [Bacteroidetes bacterium]|nr:DUF3127 domain-containing protein [Bacteroidota bacterium]
MPNFEIEGKLLRKYDTESKTANFQAREFVLEIQDGNYPQYVKFQLTQDRCPLLDPCEEGEQLKVHFDLRGREWQGKYFTNLNAWRIEKPAPVAAVNTSPAPASVPAPPATGDSFPSVNDEPVTQANEDLPF